MKKKIVSLLLALVMCLGLMPVGVFAAEANLPDWYFLFAIFKNVDANGKDKDGKTVHTKYSMTQDEIDYAKAGAEDFEQFMNSVGVMRAHVEVVEIDETITELYNDYSGGAYLRSDLTVPLLEKKVDLDRYDHVTCCVSLDALAVSWLGLTGVAFENGTGHSCINLKNREYCINTLRETESAFPASMYVHEYLHFMANTNEKWGTEFGLHDIRINHYSPDYDNGKECYTDIIQNRARGSAGTGVHPAAWQYPPHVLRTITELNIPSGVTSIGKWAFANFKNLTRVTIPSSVTSIGNTAFQSCGSLTSISFPASVTRVEDYTFANCPSLTDVYYSGSEAQWKAVQISSVSNSALTNANIHYNHLMADVKTNDWFAKPVMWAVEKGVTSGTGEGKFSPNSTCTQGQILTFLWRACGSPEPSGKVSGSEYYAVPLQWAVEQKLVDGSLSAKAPCTRADVVTYLWKLAGSPAAKAASFSDVPSNANYAQAVSWSVEQGVTGGTGPDTFAPDKACTRGQIVTFLYAALGK